MSSRGEPISLAIGIVIAVPSGVGVALSALSNNQASLVGVAISAALLPPAVNVGICFVYALFIQLNPRYVLTIRLLSCSLAFLLFSSISFYLRFSITSHHFTPTSPHSLVIFLSFHPLFVLV